MVRFPTSGRISCHTPQLAPGQRCLVATLAEEVVEVEDDSMYVENRQFRCRSGKKQGNDDAEVTEDLEEPEVSEKNTKEPEYVEMITFDVPHVTLRRPKTVR